MQIKNWMIAAALVALTACGGNKTTTTPVAEHQNVKPSDQHMMSTLWFQQSGEAKYIYRQAYRLARQLMLKNLQRVEDAPPAIIVDIDETVLDNSPYEARLILEGKSYSPESWNEWVLQANADVLPGAEEFLREAEARGIEVFYISNRGSALLEATIQNLQTSNLPFADPEHILLKTEGDQSKEERRNRVKSRFKVIVIVGDQLSDFSEELSNPAIAEEMLAQGAVQDSINKFLVLLPNPMYGSFETSLYPQGSLPTDEQKVEARRRALLQNRDFKR